MVLALDSADKATIGATATQLEARWLIEPHHLAARLSVRSVAFVLAAVLFLPGLLTTWLLVAAPLFFSPPPVSARPTRRWTPRALT